MEGSFYETEFQEVDWHMAILQPFLAIIFGHLHYIFLKTEIQTVIWGAKKV